MKRKPDLEYVRKLFAVTGEIERRREDGDDIFMSLLDPDGKLREEYGQEIERQREVLGAIVGLRTFGSSLQINEAATILAGAVHVLKWIHHQPTLQEGSSSFEAAKMISGEIMGLTYRHMMAQNHEETLRRHRLEYDPELRMAVTQKGRRGRPSPFINRMFSMMASALGGQFNKPEELRMEIRKRLSYFFSLSELDAGPQSQMAKVIEKAREDSPDRVIPFNRRKPRKPL